MFSSLTHIRQNISEPLVLESKVFVKSQRAPIAIRLLSDHTPSAALVPFCLACCLLPNMWKLIDWFQNVNVGVEQRLMDRVFDEPHYRRKQSIMEFVDM